MADRPVEVAADDRTDPAAEPTRAELEARVELARESIADTVEHIKGTVGERLDTVASTVSGVLTMSEQFQREPVAWSLGALSAGFAMGYSLGRGHHVTTKRGQPSTLARIADDVAAELATFGQGLVSPALGVELEKVFGVDLAAALHRIAAQQVPATAKRAKRRAPPAPKRRATKRPASPPRKKRT